MVELVVLRAPSGYGKTTYAKKHFPDYTLLEADQYFTSASGEYKWDQKFLYQAHKECQDKCFHNLKEGRSCVVANTNLVFRDIKVYVDFANELQVPYRIIRLCKKFQNTHGVSDEKILMMENKLQPIEGEILLTDY